MTLVHNSADSAAVASPMRTGRSSRRVVDRICSFGRRLLGGRDVATRDVFRHMLILMAGSGSAKAVSLLLTPVITRLYAPEQYGLFVLFMSSIALLTPIATLRYAAALPLPRRDGTAVALLLACIVLLGFFVLALASLFLVWSDPLFAFFSAQGLVRFWPLLVVAIALAGLYEILSNWAVRKKNFRSIAKADVSQALLGGGLKIGLATAALQHVGLFVGHIAAQAAACGLLACSALREARKFTRHATRRTMLLALVRYSAFPKYRLPSQVMLNFGQQAPVLFISATYGAATAGQLGLALSVLALPLLLLGQTTGQAYYAEIARIGRTEPERIHRITRDVTVRLLVLGLLPTMVLMFAGAWIFPFIFGARWHDAGVFGSILSIYLLAQFVANPLSHALNVFDKQHIFLRLNIVRLALVLSTFAIANQLEWSAHVAIAAYSIVLSVHYVLTSASVFAIIRQAGKNRPGAT